MTATTLPSPQAPPVPSGRAARGRFDTSRWERPALIGLLLATAVLYLWGLGASGWANSFYSAAAQAGSTSWKAFFFGSSDAANSITVDKTPASLWPMALSVRIFGLSSWSILVPQALEGVAAVGLLYATVRRWYGPAAGLLAGAVMATTPVATLMFRFNNPDSLLVLLLVGAAYATVRALEGAGTRWLVLAGTLVGFGYLAKMLQALLVVPVFALVYLLAAPTRWTRRLWQLALAGLAMVAAAGWWIAIVMMVPAKDRPYIGGSQHNSILELTLGYNGFGRLTGNETGSVTGGGGAGGPGGGGSMWGQTGWTRMFGTDIGGQVAWLIPAALILLAVGLWLRLHAARTDRIRAGYLLWGGWLLATGLTFSFMKGIFHQYYTVALAPAIGALVGIGAAHLWALRRHPIASVTLAAAVAVTSWWSYTLLGRSPNWHPWLRTTILVGGLATAAALPAVGRLGRRVALLVAAAALITALAGPAAYALDTASTPHGGSIVTAGPVVSGGGFGPGGPGGGRGRFGGPGGGNLAPPRAGTNGGTNGGTNTGQGPSGNFGGGQQGNPTFPGQNGGRNGGAPRGGGMGGLLNSSGVSARIKALLLKNTYSYEWVAAAVGSNNASGYQLATGKPVMAIGGFNGSDPSPTLAEFEKYVSEGKIHYFVGGTIGGGNGGSNASQRIASWVAAHFTALTVDGVTLYDLSGGAR
jgi:4-amino-4-deoxy-L-arabinose transferase-like glycosyltransferase